MDSASTQFIPLSKPLRYLGICEIFNHALNLRSIACEHFHICNVSNRDLGAQLQLRAFEVLSTSNCGEGTQWFSHTTAESFSLASISLCS